MFGWCFGSRLFYANSRQLGVLILEHQSGLFEHISRIQYNSWIRIAYASWLPLVFCFGKRWSWLIIIFPMKIDILCMTHFWTNTNHIFHDIPVISCGIPNPSPVVLFNMLSYHLSTGRYLSDSNLLDLESNSWGTWVLPLCLGSLVHVVVALLPYFKH